MTKRGKGKVGFAHGQDRDGQIQIYVPVKISVKKTTTSSRKRLGDFLGVEGEVMRTNMETFYQKATLSHAMTTLAHCWNSTDLQTLKPSANVTSIWFLTVKGRFVTRSKIISEIRRYLDAQGFLEVETPVLHDEAGGAAAK